MSLTQHFMAVASLAALSVFAAPAPTLSADLPTLPLSEKAMKDGFSQQGDTIMHTHIVHYCSSDKLEFVLPLDLSMKASDATRIGEKSMRDLFNKLDNELDLTFSALIAVDPSTLFDGSIMSSVLTTSQPYLTGVFDAANVSMGTGINPEKPLAIDKQCLAPNGQPFPSESYKTVLENMQKQLDERHKLPVIPQNPNSPLAPSGPILA